MLFVLGGCNSTLLVLGGDREEPSEAGVIWPDIEVFSPSLTFCETLDKFIE
jgi:hypothetical protein